MTSHKHSKVLKLHKLPVKITSKIPNIQWHSKMRFDYKVCLIQMFIASVCIFGTVAKEEQGNIFLTIFKTK